VTALGDGRLASASDDKTVRVWDASSGVCLETVLDGSPRAAELATLALPGSEVPASSYFGRTRAHFATWGAPSVYLGAEFDTASVFRLPDGRRVAAAGLRNGQVHVLELIDPPPHNG
jgi:WD40 repeat protein